MPVKRHIKDDIMLCHRGHLSSGRGQKLMGGVGTLGRGEEPIIAARPPTNRHKLLERLGRQGSFAMNIANRATEWGPPGNYKLRIFILDLAT